MARVAVILSEAKDPDPSIISVQGHDISRVPFLLGASRSAKLCFARLGFEKQYCGKKANQEIRATGRSAKLCFAT